jgi:hypothetical protein
VEEVEVEEPMALVVELLFKQFVPFALKIARERRN